MAWTASCTYGSSIMAFKQITTRQTEFDILKASHKFLRSEDEADRSLSWNDQVAKKYYSSLYREFAVCDLKHYKSGNFSLRWRTEDEVVSGAGETTCGNTRCPLHTEEASRPSLTTLELPFSYVEDGESKFALVKVVLCAKCVKKLMYKRNKEKELKEQAERATVKPEPEDVPLGGTIGETNEAGLRGDKRRRGERNRRRYSTDRERRQRNSRSRSPTRAQDRDHGRRPP
ncbi:folate-sensitive fragile site protein Fra10Ac1-domain-containing protein [Cristinia sonorae]|uniref:Folate-sensitive fragile site protein Fra10Ac1-domain-containing protein n=1 Tax=Cristinia sonorae TaxID=1940300 RepID=A0A8K0UQ20_9AGAR|nr:folate-sensitive fragile site protein Fra10Ac1-domain-containing protein [Cristinia sonorae]